MERWTPSSWRQKPIEQSPVYSDAAALSDVERQIAGFPPLVFAGEARNLTRALADVAEGRAFLLQGGDCAETFEEHSADNIRDFFRVFLQMAVVLSYAAASPVVKVGRIAGQFAKPRSSPMEKQGDIELPSLSRRHHQRHRLQRKGAQPDPARQLLAYRQSAATLNLLRAFAMGGFANLENAHRWMLGFVKNSPQSERYQKLADNITETLGFHARDRPRSRASSRTAPDRVLHLARGAAARLRTGADAGRIRRPANITRPPATCCGSATAPASPTTPISNSCAASRIRSASNAGRRSTPDGLLRLIDLLNPANEPGRLTLICRFGAEKVGEHLPQLIRAVTREGRKVVWSCDPMHGNTISAERLQDAALRPR